MRDDQTAVVILAGGSATRFPNKLEQPIDGAPMILRTYRNARALRWPVYVAGRGSFAPEIDAQLDCPLLVDRWPGRGPLGALLSACGEIACERVLVVAGDEPRVSTELTATLAAAWTSGDEAVVPQHDGRIEPLAAFYARSAVLREAFTCVRDGNGAMHSFLERLRTRVVPVAPHFFVNVNTPADLQRAARGTA